MIRKNILFVLLIFISITNSYAKQKKPTLLFYCGITMVKPITKMAKIIEDRFNCKIKISQGGSQDLYDSLKLSKKGDLYLPGSEAYIHANKKDGYLHDKVYIGHNQAAIFVHKGNPLKIQGIEDLTNENIGSILCNPNSGSIGKMTKKLLLNYKGEEFLEEAYDNTVEIGTDSRNLNNALINKRADITINWKATSAWSYNSKYIDVISIDEKYAPKKNLYINLLSFSKNKKIAREFMKFASSKEGQDIMKQYGFE